MPQRGWDGMDCVGVVWMTCSINSSHHQLGTCLRSNGRWACWARIFIEKE